MAERLSGSLICVNTCAGSGISPMFMRRLDNGLDCVFEVQLGVLPPQHENSLGRGLTHSSCSDLMSLVFSSDFLHLLIMFSIRASFFLSVFSSLVRSNNVEGHAKK